MKLLVMSDLHLEFAPFEPSDADFDVLILAGDIDLGVKGIRWAQSHYPTKTVLYVAGNHEFYKHHWTKTLDELRLEALGTSVNFLEDDVLEIDGVRFLGGSLWTDFNLFGIDTRHEAMLLAARSMTDYKKIRAPRFKAGVSGEYAKLIPIQTADRFRKTRNFLISKLAEPYPGPTVVITHHAPDPQSLSARARQSLASTAYASDLLSTLEHQPDYWIHGHIHESSDYQVGKTRVICNPRGYVDASGDFVNSAFDSTFMLEI